MKVCVIGSGLSGLCAARYLKSEPYVSEIVVYEISTQVGGTWVYTDKVGFDDHGAPIFTGMYKHLRTNIPKQCMEINGYQWPEETSSYITWESVLNYLQTVAQKEDLYKFIKLHESVSKVSRKNEIWEVTVQNYLYKTVNTKEFDAIFVCSGHFHKPNMPTIEGESLFEGTIMHSHWYRSPDLFDGKKVLIVGIGPSGHDISVDLVKFADNIYLSHHSKNVTTDKFPSMIVMKPDVKEFKANSAVFEDGTEAEIDAVIYCTGYDYDFPFLDNSCGLDVSKSKVFPLYKHIVNVNQPSMFLINMTGKVAPFIAADMHIRYAIKSLSGSFKLPSQEKMLQSIEQEVQEKRNLGHKDSNFHRVGYKELKYFNDLAAESGAEKVNTVAVVIHREALKTKMLEPQNYRSYVYKIIDQCTFSKGLPNEEPDIISITENCDP